MAATLSKHAQQIHAVLQHGISEDLKHIDQRILRSWYRCATEYGLDPEQRRAPDMVSADDLSSRSDRLAELCAIADMEMKSLLAQLPAADYTVVLSDRDNVILNAVCAGMARDNALRNGLVAGAIWSEASLGTNAIGTCMVERQPIITHLEDHFLTRNINLSCLAAPIFDHAGELIATLDATGITPVAHRSSLSLISMAAQSIENRLFFQHFRHDCVLRFHSRAELIGIIGEGALAFSPDGRVLAANRSALFLLNLTCQSEIVGKRVDEVFNIHPDMLLSREMVNTSSPRPIELCGQGSQVHAIVRLPESMTVTTVAAARPQAVQETSAPLVPATGLDALHFGDPVMTRNVRCAQRVLKSDLPILLFGETGTGKELFAKAFHETAFPGDRPFVAVNCASLPESLIESELFGYRGGAFTGAMREGRRGKILQANGGTLFLDEIGDMPMPLQARLLRVLEEREVVPLGSDRPVKVDITLLSATHHNLEELITQGRFREDLYYRLRGITITLPALRDRQDKRALIKHVIVQEAGSEVGIDDEALALMEQYNWPGNIRQLRHVLRSMLALRESERLTVADLPPEILRALDAWPPAVVVEEPKEEPPRMNALKSAERQALIDELERHHWNISRLASQLHVSRNTLYRKMKSLNIKAQDK